MDYSPNKSHVSRVSQVTFHFVKHSETTDGVWRRTTLAHGWEKGFGMGQVQTVTGSNRRRLCPAAFSIQSPTRDRERVTVFTALTTASLL